MQHTTLELLETLRPHSERLHPMRATLREEGCADHADTLGSWLFDAVSAAWQAVQTSWMELHDPDNAAEAEEKIANNADHLTNGMPPLDQPDEEYERGVMRRLEAAPGLSNA